MPSGNTNIMKKYIDEFNEIKENFYDPFRIKPNDESIDGFTENCEGLYEIDSQIKSQKEDLLKCKDFVEKLSLILKVNQLKEDSKYKELIQEVISYACEYEDAIDKLEQLLDHVK